MKIHFLKEDIRMMVLLLSPFLTNIFSPKQDGRQKKIERLKNFKRCLILSRPLGFPRVIQAISSLTQTPGALIDFQLILIFTKENYVPFSCPVVHAKKC